MLSAVTHPSLFDSRPPAYRNSLHGKWVQSRQGEGFHVQASLMTTRKQEARSNTISCMRKPPLHEATIDAVPTAGLQVGL